jgi:hypothetical protein
MEKELIYNIGFKPYNHDYYQLLGSDCKLLYFCRKSCDNKYRLARSKDRNIIYATCSKAYGTFNSLNYSIANKLIDLNFSRKFFSGYKITGKYSSYEDNINWKWKKLSICSSSMLLVDKNNNNKILAKIEGFTLKLSYSGYLKVSPKISTDLRDVIIMSACLIWKLRQEDDHLEY